MTRAARRQGAADGDADAACANAGAADGDAGAACANAGAADALASASASSAPRGVDGAALRAAMGHFATGVTIVTAAAAGGEPCGGTANAVSSLSLEPALALVCLREGSLTLATLLRARAFAFNVLGRDQEALALRFATPGLRPAERFEGIGWRAGQSGAPLLDGVVATVECGLHDVADGGDHRVVIGRVLAVEHPQRHAPPLVFHRGRFTGIAD